MALGVRESHRRAGVGKILSLWALEESDRKGISSLRLTVEPSNHGAIALYAALGSRPKALLLTTSARTRIARSCATSGPPARNTGDRRFGLNRRLSSAYSDHRPSVFAKVRRGPVTVPNALS